MCAYLTKKDVEAEFGGLHKKIEELAKGIAGKVEDLRVVVVKSAEAGVPGAVTAFSEEEVTAISRGFSEVFEKLAVAQGKIVEAGLVVETVINPKFGFLKMSVSKAEVVEVEKPAEVPAEEK